MDLEDDSFTSFFTELQFTETGPINSCNEHVLLDKLCAQTEALDQILLEKVKKENKVKQQCKAIHQQIRHDLMQIVVELTESTTNQRSGKRRKSCLKSSTPSSGILPNINDFLDKTNALVSVPIGDNALVPSYQQNDSFADILRNIKCFLDLDRSVCNQPDYKSNLSEDEIQTTTDDGFHTTATGESQELQLCPEETIQLSVRCDLPCGINLIEDNQIPLLPRDEWALWPSPKASQSSVRGNDPEIEKLQERLEEIDHQLRVLVVEKEADISLPHISSTNVCKSVPEVSEERINTLESDRALFYEMDGIKKELERLQEIDQKLQSMGETDGEQAKLTQGCLHSLLAGCTLSIPGELNKKWNPPGSSTDRSAET